MGEKNCDPASYPLGMDFHLAAKAYSEALSKRLSHLDIERYFYVPVLIDECAGKATQQCIANTLAVDKTLMVRIVNYLSEKGFLERAVNPSDRREHFLLLTVKGKKALPAIRKGIEEVNREAWARLSDKQRSELCRSMAVIRETLAALPARTDGGNSARNKKQK